MGERESARAGEKEEFDNHILTEREREMHSGRQQRLGQVDTGGARVGFGARAREQVGWCFSLLNGAVARQIKPLLGVNVV